VILDMRISAEGGDYASVSVVYPRNSRAGELKFAMFFQGYGVNTATPCPMPGYFTVHVGAHALPNRCPQEFYSGLYKGALRDYGYDPYQNKRPETTYFAGMLSRDLAAFRFFEENELLNKKDYFFIGSSQGGMQACNLAAHTDRATALILNVPWLSDVNSHELADRLENGMPKGEGIPYFDTAVAAELVKCPVYIISGLGDLTCNASTQMALFNSIRSRKYIEFYQNKTHSLTVPWDNLAYSLGDPTMKEMYREHTARYYDFN
jgi:dienelactone hydrolase